MMKTIEQRNSFIRLAKSKLAVLAEEIQVGGDLRDHCLPFITDSINMMHKARALSVVHLRESGKTNREVAKLLGVSEARASQLYVRTKKKMENGEFDV